MGARKECDWIIRIKVTLISGEINQWRGFSVVMHKQDTTRLLSLCSLKQTKPLKQMFGKIIERRKHIALIFG